MVVVGLARTALLSVIEANWGETDKHHYSLRPVVNIIDRPWAGGVTELIYFGVNFH